MGHNFTRDKCYGLQATKLKLYRNDVVVTYRGLTEPPPDSSKRGEIAEFSEDSRRRLAFVAANTSVEFRSMITLTYPSTWDNDGKEIKRHLRNILARIRRRYNNPLYLWFLEFQKRGAPHFHILLTMTVSRETKEYISRAWYDVVDSGDPKHLAAGTRCENVRKPDGARRYAVKYAQKMRQKRVPKAYRNVGRFYGYSREVEPQEIAEPVNLADHYDLFLYLAEWDYINKLKWRPLSTLYGATKAVQKRRILDKSWRRV